MDIPRAGQGQEKNGILKNRFQTRLVTACLLLERNTPEGNLPQPPRTGLKTLSQGPVSKNKVPEATCTKSSGRLFLGGPISNKNGPPEACPSRPLRSVLSHPVPFRPVPFRKLLFGDPLPGVIQTFSSDLVQT